MAEPQKIIIIDDHPILIEALVSLLLSRIGNLSVSVAPFSSDPDFSGTALVLIDIYLQGRSGLDLIARARACEPAPVIAAMSGDDSYETQYAAFAAGATAFISKSADAEKICAFLSFLLGRRADLQPLLDSGLALGQPAIRPPVKRQQDLSPREREIVMLIGQGLNNDAIARELQLSVNTVKQHVTRLLASNRVENRTQLLNALVPQGGAGRQTQRGRDGSAPEV